jgi:hypothetical protein
MSSNFKVKYRINPIRYTPYVSIYLVNNLYPEVENMILIQKRNINECEEKIWKNEIAHC